MKLTSLLTINAIVFVALGIAFTVYSPMMMAFFQVTQLDIDAVGYWHINAFARMFGAALFGFGFLIWAVAQAADTLPGATLRKTARSLALGNLIAAVAALTQQAGVWFATAGWLLTAVFAVFTVLYGYFLFQTIRRPSRIIT